MGSLNFLWTIHKGKGKQDRPLWHFKLLKPTTTTTKMDRQIKSLPCNCDGFWPLLRYIFYDFPTPSFNMCSSFGSWLLWMELSLMLTFFWHWPAPCAQPVNCEWHLLAWLMSGIYHELSSYTIIIITANYQ